MTEFTERYKKLSDKELLGILTNASSYQPIAVETAKHELSSRKLTEEQIANLRIQIVEEDKQKAVILQKRKEENEARKKDFFALFTNVNPFPTHLPLYEKQIRFMCWFFAVIALYTVVTNYTLMGFYVDDLFDGKIDADFIIYFVNIISVVLGAILFWKRKMLGWILIAFFIVTGAIGLVFSIIYDIIQPRSSYYLLDDIIAPENTVGTYGMYAIFFGTNLYVLLKEKVKKVFQIDKNISVITIALAVAIQAVMWISLLLD